MASLTSTTNRTASAKSFASWYGDGSDFPAKAAPAAPLTRASAGRAHLDRGTRVEVTDKGIAAFFAGEAR